MSEHPAQSQATGGYNPTYSGAPIPGSPIGQPLQGSLSAIPQAGTSQYYPPGTQPPPGQQPQQYLAPGAAPLGNQQYQSPSGPPLPGQPPYPAQASPVPGQYGMPQAQAPFPQAYPSGSAPTFPYGQPYHPGYAPPQMNLDPLWYLGTAILSPHTAAAPLGIQKVPGYDAAEDFAALEKAGKGGWMKSDKDDLAYINILTPLNPFQIDALSDFCTAKKGKKLHEILKDKTSGNFSNAITGLALGPLWYDVQLARIATKGFGTKDTLLIELLLGRSSAEIRFLIEGYRSMYGRSLKDDVASDVSGVAGTIFSMALNAQRPPDNLPVDFAQVTADVETLYKSGQGRPGTKELPFIEILVNRSQPHLGAVITAYGSQYKSLSKIIKSEFSGLPRDALLYIVHGAKPKRDGQGIWRDAKLLEASMAGMGTKDDQLIYRVIRAHWDPKRMEAICNAFQRRYNKSLESRVHGETSGPYRALLETLIKGEVPVKKK